MRTSPKRKALPPAAPARVDPSRTGTLRRALSAVVGRMWGELKADLLDLIAREDALGGKITDPFALLGTRPLANTRWKHAPDPQKVEAFRRWLRDQMGLRVRGRVNDDVWRAYVTRAFQQGASRARGQVTRGRTGRSPSPQEQILAGGQAFHPASYERVEGLVGRVLTELDGLTAATETRAVRALADGLATGKHPREIAKRLAEEVDIARAKAELIVRTETIRAHAEGQLDEMEKLGVQDVGVEVEFLSAADDRRCPECAKLQGTVFSIKKARGVIPVHPNCRCAWAPHLGTTFERRVNKLGGVKAAIKRGTKPKATLRTKPKAKPKKKAVAAKKLSPVHNIFCPTGAGGGIDPSSGPRP